MMLHEINLPNREIFSFLSLYLLNKTLKFAYEQLRDRTRARKSKGNDNRRLQAEEEVPQLRIRGERS
jgi:hypothetical protein